MRAIVGRVLVDVGDRVKQGQLLLELENGVEKADLALAKVQLETAGTAYDHAAKTFDRYRDLKDVIDQERYDNLLFDKTVKEKQLRQAEVVLRLKEATLEKTLIRAPFDGVITSRSVDEGDIANSELLGIADESSIKLLLSFDEKYWNSVRPGQRFVYRVDGLAGERNGTIAKVYPTADSASRKMQAEVVGEGLMPGLFGDGLITAE